MPRLPLTYHEFSDQSLTEDVEELLARFQQSDSVRYEVFSSIWREMRFSDIFIGLISIAELKRFCRLALATAVKYFLPPYSFQIRVGGLYLMFGLYHSQLAVPPVKIRLALRDWDQVQKFLQDSVSAGHQDVVYIFRKLVASKAIHYTAMPHFLTFKKQTKPKMEPVCAEFLGRSTAVQELSSAAVLEELANIQIHYEKLKQATAEVNSKVTNTTQQDFTTRLKECMTEFITWQHKTFSQGNKEKSDDDDGDDDETEAESSSRRARLLSSIKQKSYSGSTQQGSRSRRHRQVELVEASSSGAERTPTRQRAPRPPSLRARTWERLGVPQKESKSRTWLLSVLENKEKTPSKKTPAKKKKLADFTP